MTTSHVDQYRGNRAAGIISTSELQNARKKGIIGGSIMLPYTLDLRPHNQYLSDEFTLVGQAL